MEQSRRRFPSLDVPPLGLVAVVLGLFALLLSPPLHAGCSASLLCECGPLAGPLWQIDCQTSSSTATCSSDPVARSVTCGSTTVSCSDCMSNDPGCTQVGLCNEPNYCFPLTACYGEFDPICSSYGGTCSEDGVCVC